MIALRALVIFICLKAAVGFELNEVFSESEAFLERQLNATREGHVYEEDYLNINTADYKLVNGSVGYIDPAGLETSRLTFVTDSLKEETVFESRENLVLRCTKIEVMTTLPPEIKKCLQEKICQLNAEGKTLTPKTDNTLPIKLRAMGKRNVEKLIVKCAKTPSLSNVSVHYWNTWLRQVTTDWDSKPDPGITKKKYVTEKAPFYRSPSPLVSGSSYDVIEAKEEYQRIKKFSNNKNYIDERKAVLKKKYLKQKDEASVSYIARPSKYKKKNTKECLAAKIRMLKY